jgi:HEAT repeat protein
MTLAARSLLALILLATLAAPRLAGDSPAPQAERIVRDALARFEKSEPSWQTRLQAAVALAKVGPAAVPALVEALKKGALQTRLFAGEMMVLLVEPRKVDADVRAELERALENEDDFVREFAIKALNRLGALDKVKRARHILKNDPSPEIRRVMAVALKGELRDNAPAIRKALAEFDPAAIESARLGQRAPDFSLTDTAGKVVRLSQFRGHKIVVLVFLVEDD